MKQYQYQIIHKQTGRVEHARATAKTPEIARAQIVLMYGQQFDVLQAYSDINPPHRVLGEINCADFPDDALSLLWLTREAAQIEGAQA